MTTTPKSQTLLKFTKTKISLNKELLSAAFSPLNLFMSFSHLPIYATTKGTGNFPIIHCDITVISQNISKFDKNDVLIGLHL